MKFKGLFRAANNQLEGSENTMTEDLRTCNRCKCSLPYKIFRKSYYVCPKCGNYLAIGARRRILLLADASSFEEIEPQLESENILGFPEYEDKLMIAKQKSKEKDAVVCGKIKMGQLPCYIFAMESRFMMGSMGMVVGEKLTKTFELATKESLPVIGVTVSGGARMQEGMFSLLQMSKVSAAVKRHSDAGNLYLVLLTNPTTGGVDASFAMQGDIILAEPGARVGFAGPRVIEQSLKRKLPEGFQSAEAVLECGFIDRIVPREEQNEVITKILQLHKEESDGSL